ncbi:MAG: EAL domain-containing protein [Gemmatimonadota bacterium]|nr:EAL domain-containing protein [Gemmatimonadota bacterium]
MSGSHEVDGTTARRAWRGRGPFGVAGRLTLLLGGLAAASTGIALVTQDRALDQDLRAAADERLATSASVADRLVADHVQSMAVRYASISRTPELRANLETRHAETLAFYASGLLRDQSATLIAFVGEGGELLVNAGDPRLVARAHSRSLDRSDPTASCVPATAASARGSATMQWVPCTFPNGVGEGTLLESDGDLYTMSFVPLRTGARLDGGLIAVEAVDDALLDAWSELSGATIRVGTASVDALDASVRSLAGFELRVSTTYETEQAIIDRSRYNLVISGLVALGLAIAASLLLATAFTRPILRMREATERLSEGDLDHRVDIRREDELGELGHAFNELASRLTTSQERVRRAQRLAQFGNWYLDVDRNALEGTSEFRRLMRLPEVGAIAIDAVLGRVHAEDREELRRAIESAVRRRRAFQVDVRVEGTDGRDRIIQFRGHSRRSGAARLEGSIQDVTRAREAEEQIHYLSMHDPLTGLGNREWALKELRNRANGRDGTPGLTAAVVGIGELRSVIDTFGHASGEAVLIDIARRLVGSVREVPRSEGAGPDLVAKLGDERFLVLLDGMTDLHGITTAAERVLSVLRRPFPVGDDEVVLTPSLGIARWPDDAEDAVTLLRNAETALGRVQREDPGEIRLFHGSMHEDASRRLRIANLLRRAVDDRAVEFHYQPRVRPDTGALVGLEALARWTDKELGPVSPGEFIPIAEATGSIYALGTWAVQAAAKQLREWHEAGHTWLSVSVNLSQQQLDPDLVGIVLEATEGLDPASFELEVTESALIEEGDAAIETLTALRAHGFRIALDDFGTGYSSLSYLQGLPIDTVKVDRGFIRDIAEDEDAAALTGSVLDMCGALRLHTVVEGVETEAQLETLLGLGAAEVQGFFFARPLPVDEATLYIESATPAEPLVAR